MPLLDAIVQGVQIIEDDPEELSVGFGGLPKELGIVEPATVVMLGPLHKAGTVAGLRGIRHAAAVALQVLRRTDHALLVGEGVLAFARAVGYKESDLLTPKASNACLGWKGSHSPRDGWLTHHEATTGTASPADADHDAASQADTFDANWAGRADNPTPGAPPSIARNTPALNDSYTPPKVPFTYGTIHVTGRNSQGDLFAVTSTSGLSCKILGRVAILPSSATASSARMA